MNLLLGLDLARYFALVGMVLVNFNVVMVPETSNDPAVLSGFLQGKAAALFVVLAGIGFSLSSLRKPWGKITELTYKRFFFLLLLGLLNALIFQADIIHYYAFYFLFGLWFLRSSNQFIALNIVLLVLLSFLLVVVLNYDRGWNWETYHYQDFWTLQGFIRNLFFNGWHPIIPWLGFLLFGIILGRTNLSQPSTQARLLTWGLIIYFITALLSKWLLLIHTNSELALLVTTKPIPPMPQYMISAGSLAAATVGLCLLTQTLFENNRIYSFFTTTGRQTLSWYIIHIIVGMGLLETFNMLGNQTPNQALTATLLFCSLMTILGKLWSLKFSKGPLELFMHKLTE